METIFLRSETAVIGGEGVDVEIGNALKFDHFNKNTYGMYKLKHQKVFDKKNPRICIIPSLA